ncbi:MAG: DUF389 domain-containing protein [Anaerolineaceae bacterium]|nr:MAG: DUF389 domain-containing protein [Anaerolineaceae bacterium]
MMNVLSQILQDNRFTPENLPDLENKLFFEGDRRRPYLVRFTVLLFLSTIIAAYGVLADSTATVIGAMIIAPLMNPIVATTAALVMGRAKRAVRSILIVAGGIIIVITLSAIIGLITFNVISVTTNSQIASRTSPNLDDLIVAMAAGAAAAFAYSRADVADSLPGVAIAIALVPPLSVVGITLSQGEWDAAGGASLLFLTNLLSILLAGGIVFLLLDLGGASFEERELTRARARRVYAFITLGVLLVTVPLAAATFRVAKNSANQSQIGEITLDWLDRNDIALELREVNVFNRDVEIIVNGSDEPEPISELREELESAFPQMEEVIMKIDVAEAILVPKITMEE